MNQYLKFYSNYEKKLWIIYACLFVWISYRCFWFALDSSLDMQWYPTMQFWGGGTLSKH